MSYDVITNSNRHRGKLISNAEKADAMRFCETIEEGDVSRVIRVASKVFELNELMRGLRADEKIVIEGKKTGFQYD